MGADPRRLEPDWLGADEPLDIPLPPRHTPKKGKKPAQESTNPFEAWTEDLVAEGISSLYAGIAIWRGRDWWSRSPQECMAAARPVMGWLKSLPPSTFAMVEKHLPMGAIGLALWNLTWPGLIHEWEEMSVRSELRDPESHHPGHQRSGAGGAGTVGADGEAISEDGRAPGTIHLPRRATPVSNGNGSTAR